MSIQSLKADLDSIDKLLKSYQKVSKSKASVTPQPRNKGIAISKSAVFNIKSHSHSVTPNNKFAARDRLKSKPLQLKLKTPNIKSIFLKRNPSHGIHPSPSSKITEKAKTKPPSYQFETTEKEIDEITKNSTIRYKPYSLKDYEFLRSLPNYRARSLGQDMNSEKFEQMHTRKKLMDEYSGLLRAEHWLKFNDKLKITTNNDHLPPLNKIDDLASQFKKTLHYSKYLILNKS